MSANSGYKLPNTISVSGATYTYNSTTGVVVLSQPTGNITISCVCEVVVATCTVTGLGSSSPTGVTFTKNANFTVQGLGIEEVTKNGDTFIKIPTMYRKVNTVSDNQITSFTIANAKVNNNYKPYSCFLDENGGLLSYVLIGKYNSNSSTTMKSVSSTYPAAQTIGNARTNARNRGTGYQQYDWQIHKLWQDLIICFKTTINTNSGSTWTYDELGIYWGADFPWIDGITNNRNSKTFIFSYKPSKYVDQATTSTDGYQACGYTYSVSGTSGDELSKLGYNSTHPFVNYPTATTSNSSYNTYYCDAFWFGSSGTYPVKVSIGFANAQYGAFCYNGSYGWAGVGYARLCYRPIGE